MTSLMSPASPVMPCTPAMLQGGLAPWGPTPSPSPLIREPAPNAIDEGYCGSSTGKTLSEPTPEQKWPEPAEGAVFTKELLLEICAPYIEKMLQALCHAVEVRFERLGAKLEADPEDEAPAAAGEEGEDEEADDTVAKTGTMPAATNDPFRSLFDRAPSSMSRRQQHFRLLGGKTTLEAPLQEVPEGPSPCPSPVVSVTQTQVKADFMSFTQPAGATSSRCNSPTGCEVPSQQQIGGNVAQENAAVNNAKASVATTGAIGQVALQGLDQNVQPLYLTWGQQNPGTDHQLSPAPSPLMPTTTPQPPNLGAFVLGFGMQGAGQEPTAGDSTATGQAVGAAGTSPAGVTTPVASASSGDKSVMVCRHWKSKGWCRMEADCKFLHPEHKRGTLGAAAAQKASASSATPAIAEGGSPEGFDAARPLAAGSTASPANRGQSASAAGKSSRQTRRSGRGRTTGRTPPAAVAVGLVPGPISPTSAS
mmetsp:Transcript_43971/g.121667  ORF Transcript_43971/g.121667 Transcript_43971/m.121667 type:complete len:478 (+) Transcript_43971:79-1512(+)